MHNSWARQLTDRLGYKNSIAAGKSGGGNRFIANAVIYEAHKAVSNGKIPDITVMWSSPTRYEFPIHHKETPYYTDLYNKDTNDFNPGFYNRDDSSKRWLLGAGTNHLEFNVTKSKKVNHTYTEVFSNQMKYVWNAYNQWQSTLTSILLIQSLCESNGWNYRFATFRDYVSEYRSHASEFPEFDNLIKWDKFTFTNDTTGGLREYTLANLNTWDDGYDNHPSAEAHADFLDNFWLKKHSGVYEVI